MNGDKKHQDDRESTDESSSKKPYRPPEILYRQPLEASAVVCTAPGSKSNPGMCPSGPITS